MSFSGALRYSGLVVKHVSRRTNCGNDSCRLTPKHPARSIHTRLQRVYWGALDIIGAFFQGVHAIAAPSGTE